MVTFFVFVVVQDYIERSGGDISDALREDVSRVSLLGTFVDEFVKQEPTHLLEIPVGDPVRSKF